MNRDPERESRLLATWLLIALVCVVFVWAVATGPVAGGREEDWCRAAGEDPVRFQVQGGRGGYVVLCKHPTGVLSVPREPKE